MPTVAAVVGIVVVPGDDIPLKYHYNVEAVPGSVLQCFTMIFVIYVLFVVFWNVFYRVACIALKRKKRLAEVRRPLRERLEVFQMLRKEVHKRILLRVRTRFLLLFFRDSFFCSSLDCI